MNREEREAVGIQDLPSTLYTAIKAMKENQPIKDALGNHIYNQFINSKSIEGITTEHKYLNGKENNILNNTRC